MAARALADPKLKTRPGAGAAKQRRTSSRRAGKRVTPGRSPSLSPARAGTGKPGAAVTATAPPSGQRAERGEEEGEASVHQAEPVTSFYFLPSEMQ